MTIPAGWKIHPEHPEWMYEEANTANMAPVPAAAPGAIEERTYGTLNVDAAVKEQKLFKGGDSLYIDFPDYDQSGWSALKLRLLPPWTTTNITGYVQVARHRAFADHYPQDVRGNRKIFFETCLNMAIPGGVQGPGDCPFCENKRDATKAGLDKKSLDYLNNFSARVATVWQAIDFTTQERLNKHFVQRKDERGHPVLDAAGQPVWDVIPARIRMGNELLSDIRAVMRMNGDPTHPDHGYLIAALKQKTGPNDMDVTYKAQIGGSKERLPDQLRPVLGNLLDLEKEEISFTDRNLLRQVADSVRAQIGLPLKWSAAALPAAGGGLWVIHPENAAYEYNTATNQVRARA